MQTKDEPLRLKKPTLLQIREQHHLTLLDIAEASQMEDRLVWYALINREVTRCQASRILAGINALAHTSYQLEDLRMNITDSCATSY